MAIKELSKEKIGAAAKFAGVMKMSEKEKEQLMKRIKDRRNEINKEFQQRQKYIRKMLSHTRF